MDKTLKMLRTLVVPGTETMSLEDIAKEYRGSLSPSLFALAFVKIHKLVFCVSEKYVGLNSDDIASYTLEKLDYCLLTYEQGDIKFSTYFTTVLKNKFREETESLNTHKRKSIFYTDSYEQMIENGYDVADDTILQQNLHDELKSCNLSDRELLFCKCIIEELSSKDTATLLGVSQMTLTNMRKKLRQKLAPIALNFA